MSTDPQATAASSPAFEFKSGVITIPVLNLFSTDINVITHQLREKIKQAPEFFTNSSLLLDLSMLQDQDLNLALLVDAIRNSGMRPIGVRGGTAGQHQDAKDLMLPIMAAQNSTSSSKQEAPAKVEISTQKIPEPVVSTTITSTIINQPIRSGQRVYVKGDLIIITQVSAGAEVMAEGNIHIYGTLRGRALAGVQGDESAQIFCSDLQAELVSVAGNYRISEDLDESNRNTPVQIYLNNQALIIKNI
ncbi:MAG: septum site-determining protein MinC [Methyloprofundus sp.]|nr:septum site-determining protein MinC [Methyloprofundus sp.]MBW6452597.1 septum site-determining protein MinC [Methyloprofundus sp.]